MTRAIFFLSDYGHRDEFVGVVHAVLQRMAPDIRVVDLGHEVPAFDVVAGARMLARAVPFCGPGVVLAVVDPGVGTARRGVAIEVAGDLGAARSPAPASPHRPAVTAHSADAPGFPHPGGPTWLVGPDNGLLLPVAATLGGIRQAVGLTGVSTFDGRDVFAPAAAALVLGQDPGLLGAPIDPGTLVQIPDPAFPGIPGPAGTASETVSGTFPGAPPSRAVTVAVSWIDTFGNVQLDCRPEQLDRMVTIGARLTVSVGDLGVHAAGSDRGSWTVRRVGAFGELAEGELGMLVDGNGQLAIVAARASAARLLGLEGRQPAGPGPPAPPMSTVARGDSGAALVPATCLRLVFP